ncbi:hypothetical protein CQA89_33205, partial [Klebsiella pneumoniae]
MTGVPAASVGRYIGVILILLGLFPPVGELLRQNNGVIQMTGVPAASVGRYIGVILILLGLFPPVGELLRQ